MRILLLGTSGYHPTASRHTACVLLPELGIALDAGTGMFRMGRSLQTPTLDIFLSHAHLDHVVGLTYFFTMMHEHPLDRVTVHGEASKLAAIQSHLFAPELFPAVAPFEWKPLNREAVEISGATVRHFPLIHPGGSTGFRIEHDGKSIAYVTDTTAIPSADYVQHIQGVDLLIHECNFPGNFAELAGKTGHSTLTQVAAVAKAAKVKRLVLMHFDPVLELPAAELAEARRVFDPITLGHDECELVV